MIPDREARQEGQEREIFVSAGEVRLAAKLHIPREPRGIVLFAHGSGSSSRSPRNRHAAKTLQAHGMATVLFDLLTRGEELIDELTEQLPFNISLLAKRLLAVTEFIRRDSDVGKLPLGFLGAGTGTAAALATSAEIPEAVAAIVSRGGRPDLAVQSIRRVQAATLLIVGGEDKPVMQWNRKALAQLRCPEKNLVVIPGATDLLEEPGAIEEVARLASAWFAQYLVPASASIPDASPGSSQAGRAS